MSPTSKEIYQQYIDGVIGQIAPKINKKMSDMLSEASDASLQGERERATRLVIEVQHVPQIEDELKKLINQADPVTEVLIKYGFEDFDFNLGIAPVEKVKKTLYETQTTRKKPVPPHGEKDVVTPSDVSAKIILAIVDCDRNGIFKYNDQGELEKDISEYYGGDISKTKESIKNKKTLFRESLRKTSILLREKNSIEKKSKSGTKISEDITMKKLINFIGEELYNPKHKPVKPKDPLENVVNDDWRKSFQMIRARFPNMTYEEFSINVLFRKEIGGRPSAIKFIDREKIRKEIIQFPRTEAVLCNAILKNYDDLKDIVFDGDDPLSIAKQHGWKGKGELSDVLRESCEESSQKDKLGPKQSYDDAVATIRNIIDQWVQSRKGMRFIREYNFPAWELVYSWIGKIGKDPVKVNRMLEALFPGVNYCVEKFGNVI